jgi:multicomponent Na+:H+ antiporter subunit G
MMEALVPWLADGLALFGLIVLTLGVYGLVRFPNVSTRIHAAGTAGVMGVLPILLAVMLGSDTSVLPLAFLVGCFLVLTSPIVSHEIGRAEHLRDWDNFTPR